MLFIDYDAYLLARRNHHYAYGALGAYLGSINGDLEVKFAISELQMPKR
jgi:hypothetical protein